MVDWTTSGQGCLSRQAVGELSFPTAPLDDVGVRLTSGHGTAKRHRVVVAKSWHERCRHVSEGDHGDVVSLLDVDWRGVCVWCARSAIVGLEPAPRAYVRLLTVAARVHGWLVSLEGSAPTMTWPVYCRFLSTNPFCDGRWLAATTDYARVGSSAVTGRVSRVAGRWGRRVRQALDAGAEAAGATAVKQPVEIGQVADRLSHDKAIRHESNRIAALAGDTRFGEYYNVWSLAATAWREQMGRDTSAESAHTAMHLAVERRYLAMPVRDATLLGRPVQPAADFTRPSCWANAEFAVLRARTVARWAGVAAEAFASAVRKSEDEGLRLLALTAWPRAAHGDTTLAYLAQYPVVARGVSTSLLLGGHTYRQDDATTAEVVTVLRVPQSVADHVAAVAARWGRWVRVGAAGRKPTVSAATEMLADVAVLLADEKDGRSQDDVAQAEVLEARESEARRYADLVAPVRLHSVDDEREARRAHDEVRYAWHEGRLPWLGVCSRAAVVLPGLADTAGLRELAVNGYAGTQPRVRIVVHPAGSPFAEHGPTAVTALIDHVDDTRLWARGRPDSTTFTIPLRRVVAVTTA